MHFDRMADCAQQRKCFDKAVCQLQAHPTSGLSVEYPNQARGQCSGLSVVSSAESGWWPACSALSCIMHFDRVAACAQQRKCFDQVRTGPQEARQTGQGIHLCLAGYHRGIGSGLLPPQAQATTGGATQVDADPVQAVPSPGILRPEAAAAPEISHFVSQKQNGKWEMGFF